MNRTYIGIVAGLILFVSGAYLDAQNSGFYRIESTHKATILDIRDEGRISWTYESIPIGQTTGHVQTATSLREGDWRSVTAFVTTGAVMSVDIPLRSPPPDRMVLIPAGRFAMGDAHDDSDNDFEIPVHDVEVDGFLLDQFLVTQTLWNQVYAWAITNHYEFSQTVTASETNHPVHSLNWYDAVKWCNARSEMMGILPAYYTCEAKTNVYRSGEIDIGNSSVRWNAGFRLPTEAEWEKAARGVRQGKRFPWGNTISHDQANYQARAGHPYDLSGTSGAGYHPHFSTNTSPVDFFPPNGYGMYDMAGNLWDWCWDWSDADIYTTEPRHNPWGPETGSNRVVRGGAYESLASQCRVSHRANVGPAYTDRSIIGFRTVLPLGFDRREMDMPPQLYFGEVDVGESHTVTVTITNIGHSRLTISNIQYPNGFNGHVSESNLAPKESISIDVTFSPTRIGDYTGPLQIRSDATEGPRTILLTGTGTAGSVHSCESLDFGEVDVGSTDFLTCIIINTGNVDVVISNIEPPDGFTVNWTTATIPAGASSNLTVEFRPSRMGFYDGLIIIESDAMNRRQEVEVTGFGVLRTLDSCGSLHFGAVDVDTTNTLSCTITNTGNVDVVISNIEPPDGFTVNWTTPTTIPAGASSNLVVTFNPTEERAYAGEIRIHYNADDSPTIIHVSGAVLLDFVIIDLSAGPDATHYPVHYTNAPPVNGWTNGLTTTTQLVLRRIPNGVFTMGSPTNEVGRFPTERIAAPKQIDEDFYIGVFPVTQKQWERVMGNWPSHFSNVNYRASRPLENRSWNDIRGNLDPEATFIGRLRERTELNVDLPTEKQWEYACRAGTTTALNSGLDLTNSMNCPNMSAVGRYGFNHIGGFSNVGTVTTDQGTARVGTYVQNNWGLYDMHGNVLEWCLDETADRTQRIVRGGNFQSQAGTCRSAFSSSHSPSSQFNFIGFRLVKNLQ